MGASEKFNSAMVFETLPDKMADITAAKKQDEDKKKLERFM